jgi:hypothetical protein
MISTNETALKVMSSAYYLEDAEKVKCDRGVVEWIRFLKFNRWGAFNVSQG